MAKIGKNNTATQIAGYQTACYNIVAAKIQKTRILITSNAGFYCVSGGEGGRIFRRLQSRLKSITYRFSPPKISIHFGTENSTRAAILPRFLNSDQNLLTFFSCEPSVQASQKPKFCTSRQTSTQWSTDHAQGQSSH